MSLGDLSPLLVQARLDALMGHCGLPTPFDTHIDCDGFAPGCRPAVGEAAAVALAAVGSDATLLRESRGGAGQSVSDVGKRYSMAASGQSVQTLEFRLRRR